MTSHNVSFVAQTMHELSVNNFTKYYYPVSNIEIVMGQGSVILTDPRTQNTKQGKEPNLVEEVRKNSNNIKHTDMIKKSRAQRGIHARSPTQNPAGEHSKFVCVCLCVCVWGEGVWGVGALGIINDTLYRPYTHCHNC